ncbi:MAG: rod shape-determining protein [bacterium]|nr:rod shape-determining protein [bacterium]
MFDRFASRGLGIDLGTATTLVFIPGKGIVLNEPTVVAFDVKSKHVIAVGKEAKQMLGRTPDTIRAIRPMRDGVIANFEAVEELLKQFIMRVKVSGLFAKPRVVVAVPSGTTDVERRAVRDSVEHAGASEAWLVLEPVASAIGAGLEIDSSFGNMIIDIGGGTTEIAVIALSNIVCNESIRVAGDEMNLAVVDHLKKKYNLLIGESTGEAIKIEIGSAALSKEEKSMEVRGRDAIGGLPKAIKINSKEIREALQAPITEIIRAIKLALEKTPPELSSDIIEQGITLTGGGSLLNGLGGLISKETGLIVKTVDNPIECVVKGTGKVLEKFEKYRDILV